MGARQAWAVEQRVHDAVAARSLRTGSASMLQLLWPVSNIVDAFPLPDRPSVRGTAWLIGYKLFRTIYPIPCLQRSFTYLPKIGALHLTRFLCIDRALQQHASIGGFLPSEHGLQLQLPPQTSVRCCSFINRPHRNAGPELSEAAYGVIHHTIEVSRRS
jgi:hypothetical protein